VVSQFNVRRRSKYATHEIILAWFFPYFFYCGVESSEGGITFSIFNSNHEGKWHKRHVFDRLFLRSFVLNIIGRYWKFHFDAIDMILLLLFVFLTFMTASSSSLQIITIIIKPIFNFLDNFSLLLAIALVFKPACEKRSSGSRKKVHYTSCSC
jgi:hypothetical protein